MTDLLTDLEAILKDVSRRLLVYPPKDQIDIGMEVDRAIALLTAHPGEGPQCPWCTRDGRGPRELELQWVCEHCGFRGTAEDYEKAVPALGGSKL